MWRVFITQLACLECRCAGAAALMASHGIPDAFAKVCALLCMFLYKTGVCGRALFCLTYVYAIKILIEQDSV